jgi:hypothetical protein
MCGGGWRANDPRREAGAPRLFRRRGHYRLDRRRAVVPRQVRVTHGHADVLVAEELLHRPEIARSHDDPRREGVPEVMPVKVLDPWFEECIKRT